MTTTQIPAIKPSISLAQRCRLIQFLAVDVDGVMTRGDITMDGSDNEWKSFHVRDGIILKSLPALGIATGIITGRTSGVVSRRAADLGIRHVLQGAQSKEEGLLRLSKSTGIPLEGFAYMGDDLPDVEAMKKCGLAAAPADACAITRLSAHLVTHAEGGMTAIRELGEIILKAQGKWDQFQSLHR